MGRKRKLPECCQDCSDCQYIGEGDYACMKEEPKVVLTGFGMPTDDFLWCRKEKKL